MKTIKKNNKFIDHHKIYSGKVERHNDEFYQTKVIFFKILLVCYLISLIFVGQQHVDRYVYNSKYTSPTL